MSYYYFYKGRVALYSLLRAFDIGIGDRVLIPGYTCIVVPSAVRYVGAIPEYVDIDSESYNSLLPCYKQTYHRLKEFGKVNGLKAIIIQHTYGNPNKDTLKIIEWAHNKNLYVIEDCCHINRSLIEGQLVGNLGEGAFFSTQWSKPFTTGLGGIAKLNIEQYAIKMENLESKAASPNIRETMVLALQLLAHKILLRPSLYWYCINMHRKLAKLGLFIGSSTIDELDGKMPNDYFKGMSGLQKVLLKQKSKNMEKINQYRQWLSKEYDKLLIDKGLPIFKREEQANLLRYPIRVRDKITCLSNARDRKIEIGEWFDHPLHPAGSNLEGLNWKDSLCPNAVIAAQEVVNMPVHIQIDNREATRIVDFISEWVKY